MQPVSGFCDPMSGRCQLLRYGGAMGDVVSIILNVHNEAEFLDRTCQSLCEATSFAQSETLSFELVVVLDKPSANVRSWCRQFDFARIAPAKFVEISDGSLGLARQAGLEAASGDYITTADADDLVSFNYFDAAYAVARAADPRTIVSQEFVFAFGNSRHRWQYFPSNRLTKLIPFFMNPYTSRIFARREFILQLKYLAPDQKKYEAYEDWDINSRALALNGNFQVARDTILFYRIRRKSIMGGLIGTERLPRFSEYHEPSRFLRMCQLDYERYISGRLPPAPSSDQIRTDIKSRSQLLHFTAAANLIDPEVIPDQLSEAPLGSNLNGDRGWGAAYYEACSRVAGQSFTDVVLLPYIARGGAEKFIFSVIDALRNLDPSRSFLVLGGESMKGEHALDWLPEGATFVDLYAICQRYAPESVDVVTLRLVQSLGATVNIHLKASAYAEGFFDRFNAFIDRQRAIYYYFTDARCVVDGLAITIGHSFKFISRNHHGLDVLISDHGQIFAALKQRIPVASACIAVAAFCKVIEERCARSRQGPFRLLWASRLDPQKRPELVPLVARALRNRRLDVEIDIYGATAHGDVGVGRALEGGLVSFKGAFGTFREIPTGEYDAFLYTAAFDGLPNVILEAMASGLPVVAPRIGGIPEAVDDTRGILIDADCSDDELVTRYADAVTELARRDCETLGQNGVDYVRRAHSFEGLVETLKGAGI